MPTPRSNDWRATTRKQSAGSKRTQGALLLLLTTALLVLLAIYLWRDPSQTFVVRAEAIHDEWPFLPTYEYPDDNVSLYDNSLKLACPTDAVEISEDNPGTIVRQIQGQIQAATQATPSKQDTLLLHLRCFTHSFDDKAYLLGSEFENEVPADSENAYPLKSLLQEVDALPFQTKVLILDGLRLPPSAWRGSLSNQVPSLANEAMQQSELGANLWLILPTSEHQQSRVSHVLGKSIFTKALELTLQSNEEDHELTLGEFFTKLRDFSNYLSKYQQTPQLYRGGQGLYVRDKDLTVANSVVLALTREKPPTEEGPEETQESEETAVRTRSAARYYVSAEAAEESAPTEQSTSEEPIPEQLTLLEKLWQLRDAAMRETGDTIPLPLDYAPHQWRTLNLALVKLEESYPHANDKGYRTEEGGKTVEPVQQMLSITRQAAKQNSHISLSRVIELLKTIEQLRQRYERVNKSLPAWMNSHEAVKRRRLCARQFSRALFQAQYYVQWFDQASVTQEIDPSEYQGLQSFLEQLVLVKRSLQVSPEQSAEQVLDQVEGQIKQLKRDERVLTDMVNGQLRDQCDLLLDEGWDYQAEVQLQDLLSLPLLDDQQRSFTINCLAQAKKTFAGSEADQSLGAYTKPQDTVNHESRLEKRVKLNSLLLTLADFNADANAASGTETGSAFHALYRQLATSDGDASTSESLQGNLSCRLADGRDKFSTDRRMFLPPIPGTIAASATIHGRRFLQVSKKGSTALQLDISPFGDALLDKALWGRFDFSADQLDLQQESGSQVVASQPFRIAAQAVGPERETHTLSYLVSLAEGYHPDLAEPPPTVTLQVFDEEPSASTRPLQEAAIVVHGSSVFQLVAQQKLYRRWSETHEANGPQHHLELRAFPNRENIYAFGVRNLSGIEKTIRVQLYKVKDSGQTEDLIFGSAFHPATQELLPEYEKALNEGGLDMLLGPKIAVTAAPLTLPNSKAVKWLPLETPQADAKDGSKPSPEPAGTEDCTLPRGLLCEVLDVTVDPEQPQKSYHWIDFSPHHPREYLAEPTAKIDKNGHPRIDVRLRENFLPHNIGGLPVKVEWHPLNGYERVLSVTKSSAELTTNQPTDSVRARRNASSGALPPLVIDVDGNPRAFRFLSENRNYDLHVSAKAIYLEQLTPLGVEETEPSRPGMGTPSKPLVQNEAVALEGTLQVEVPNNWRVDQGHHLVVKKFLKDEAETLIHKRIYDRVSHQATFKEVANPANSPDKRGELAIDFAVEPIRFIAHEANSGEFNGYLQASLFYEGKEIQQDDNSGEPSRYYYIIDTREPWAERVRFQDNTVTRGQEASLSITANDTELGTGVSRVLWYYGPINAKSEAEALEARVTPDRRGVIKLIISTAELEPIQPSYRFHVLLVDQAGNASPWYHTNPDNDSALELTLVDKKVVKPKTNPKNTQPVILPKLKTYSLKVVLLNDYDRQIAGDALKKFKVKCNGKSMKRRQFDFYLDELPEGDYKIEAAGEQSYKQLVGSDSVSIPDSDEITITLSQPEKEKE